MENMEIEKPSEHPRKTTKSYASSVFQESSVGIVASLAHTASKKRRVYKVIAFILCLTGFLYQSGTFLAAVLQYPTSVGLDIRRPNVLTVPAFSFCDNNGVNREMFCDKFPDKCEEPTETFCKKFSSYCGGKTNLVPKKEYYSFRSLKTLGDMMDVNHKMEDFVTVDSDIKVPEKLSAPYLRHRDDFDSTLICYSLYDRVNNSLLPPHVKKNVITKEPVVKFEFRVVENETFVPGSQSGVLFAVHSPFQAVNPFEIGIFMKPGRKYLIFVSIEEEVLLPKPYSTDCINYTDIWLKNGRIGPRTQAMCLQDCIIDVSIQCFNCVIPELIFGTRERYCSQEETVSSDRCPEDYQEQLQQCYVNCKEDCSRKKFSYTIQERYSAYFDESGNENEDVESKIEAEIYLEEDEIVILKHSPKYMFVEVFSNIGGFIGCWLGINLLDITDIMEGFFRITRYSVKKR